MTDHAPTAADRPRPRFLGAINRHHTEIAAAILLSIATVLTAWCAYQATRWSGVQSIRYAEASAARVESTRA